MPSVVLRFITLNLLFIVAAAVPALSLMLAPAITLGANPNMPQPDKLGPFGIGYTERVVVNPAIPIVVDCSAGGPYGVGCVGLAANSLATLSCPGGDTTSTTCTVGLPTRVMVWYPTDATAGTPVVYQDLANIEAATLNTKFGALEDAPLSDSGPFPLVTNMHGNGGDPGLAAYIGEHSASHGFVFAASGLTGNVTSDAFFPAGPECKLHDYGQTPPCDQYFSCATRAPIASFVISEMLAASADAADRLHGSINPDKVGASGVSLGGGTALTLASGNAGLGLPADDRVQAMLLFAPSIGTPSDPNCGLTPEDRSTVTIPTLIMAGDSSSSFEELWDVFPRELPPSTPRYLILNPGGSNYTGATCDAIAAIAEASAFPGNPYTNFGALLPEFGGAGDAASHLTFLNWNAHFFSSRQGLSRTCSLSPYYDPLDPPNLTSITMERLMNLYTVAFFKVRLENDLRYQPFLTGGYAVANEPDAEVLNIPRN